MQFNYIFDFFYSVSSEISPVTITSVPKFSDLHVPLSAKKSLSPWAVKITLFY
jgi:hypothetical protein